MRVEKSFFFKYEATNFVNIFSIQIIFKEYLCSLLNQI